MALEFATGQSRTIYSGADVGEAAWSPDGKQIAFTARSVRDEVFLKKIIIPASHRK